MIVRSVRHRGLRRLVEEDNPRFLRQSLVDRVRKMVTALILAEHIDGFILHFSPRGEAKWVRGPSGRGASRLARTGVLDSTLSTASKRNEVLAVVSRVSTVGW